METTYAVGLEADFYGVDGHCFKLNETVFRAVEDEEDGYRSRLQELEVVKDTDGLIFFQTPIARVRVVNSGDGSFEGETLVDVTDDHEWLKVGTSDTDDYYPYFTFSYQPKLPSQVG